MVSERNSDSTRRDFLRTSSLVAVGGTVAIAGCFGAGKPDSIAIRIDYSGEWSGAVGSGGSSQSVDGFGRRTFQWDGGDIPNVVSATAQKRERWGTLTVQIIADGEVVKESSTRAEFGVVSIGHSF